MLKENLKTKGFSVAGKRLEASVDSHRVHTNRPNFANIVSSRSLALSDKVQLCRSHLYHLDDRRSLLSHAQFRLEQDGVYLWRKSQHWSHYSQLFVGLSRFDLTRLFFFVKFEYYFELK